MRNGSISGWIRPIAFTKYSGALTTREWIWPNSGGKIAITTPTATRTAKIVTSVVAMARESPVR